MEPLDGTYVSPKRAFELLGPKTMKQVEALFMQYVLDKCEWNLSLAAKQLKISRATMYRKVKEHGLGKAE